jgi:hypothetical protein
MEHLSRRVIGKRAAQAQGVRHALDTR